MYSKASKVIALMGGVATLALGSTFMLRLPARSGSAKTARLARPCAPRLLELEHAECQPLSSPGSIAGRPELALR
jgi:hypothetical protein